ncbi:MAG: efflux RND transporter periplasmic adaptor subunit [Phycisphaerales bacterium]|nr:efflux RND transporter periplasmic adaptor subunit [Phycisphaerales bacterium]
MIDLSKIKAPGWQRVVEELSRPAPDDRAFLARLLSIQAQVSGARQGVLYAVPPAQGAAPGAEPEPTPLLIWPPAEGGTGEPGTVPIEHESEARDAARAAGGSRQTRVFGLEKSDGLYEGGSQAYMVGVSLSPGSDHAPGHVITLLIEARTRQALQTTLALVEVVAGYIHAHAARRELARARASSASLDLAVRLIASINQAAGFRGACMQVCNDLTRHLALDRAALGWVKGVGANSGTLRAVAMSDTEHFDRRMAFVKKVEAAMDECFDQEQAVLHPVPPAEGPAGDVLLGQAIAHAHRELASADAKLRVASVPLRVGDDVLGVLTVESAADASTLGVPLVELLQAAMDLVAPVLAVRRSDDRVLALRAVDSTRRAGSWLVGPRHTIWKLALVAATIAVLAAVFVTVPYRIEAPMELTPRTQRIVSAPFDGVIDRLGEHAIKGSTVKAGDLLVSMRTTELHLGLQDALVKMQQAQTRADASLREGKLEEAEQAKQDIEAAKAQIDLLRYRIDQAELRSPIDGVIVDGDLRERVGSTVKLGDAFFVIARVDDMIAVAKVSDTDVSYIAESMRGELATRSDPAATFGVHVERLVPMARAEGGSNTFEVRAALDETAPWMRPGMEGIVKLNTGPRSIAWILTRRIRDTARLWLWW